MAEPIREQMLVVIVDKLQAMDGIRPWGGQYEAVPRVTRRWFPIGPNIKEFPYLIVSAGSGSTLPLTAIAGLTVARFEHSFRVLVYGYVQGNDETSASTWLQRLQDDVIDTMLRNQTLDGVCQEVFVEEDQTDDGVLEPLGGFCQAFKIVAPEDRAIE